MKDNKFWYDILQEFSEYEWCKNEMKKHPNLLDNLLSHCHLTNDIFGEYREDRDYRSIVASMYFTNHALAHLCGEREKPGNDANIVYGLGMSRVLFNHNLRLNALCMNLRKKYQKLRIKYNIAYPERLEDLPDFRA